MNEMAVANGTAVWRDWWDREVTGPQFHSIRFLHWTPFVQRQVEEAGIDFSSHLHHVPGLLAQFEWETFASSGFAVIEGWEVLCDSPNGAAELGMLRARVMEHLPQGAIMVMLSTAPRPLYPETIGSRLILDAHHILPPTRELISEGPPSARGECLPGVSRSPRFGGLVEEMAAGLPAYVLGEIEERVFAAGITLSDAAGDRLLSAEAVECLTAHGLLWNSGGYLEWIHSGNGSDRIIRECFETEAARLVAPDALARRTFEAIWRAERNLRQLAKLTLRVRAGKPGSSWKKQISKPEWVDNILRKSKSSGYSHANRMVDISNPLDWLSFDELCVLLLENRANLAGLTVGECESLRSDLAGVRNRVAHLRLLTSADYRTAKQWDIRIRRARERAEKDVEY
jgi:hypothetical protein